MENQKAVAIPEAELNDLPPTFDAWVAWFAERGATVDLFTHLEPLYPIELGGEANGFIVEYEAELTLTASWTLGRYSFELEGRGTGITPLDALKGAIRAIRNGMGTPYVYSR